MSNVSTFTRATRYITEIPALYRVVGEDNWRRGLTVNISESGVLLQAAAPLELHTRIEMTFHIPEPIGAFHAGQLTCIGEVVRLALPTTASRFPIGARFVEFRGPA